MLQRIRPRRGLLFGVLIIGALIAFEAFNYSTTDFALRDLLGDLRFAGIRWATILAIAFCGIDFAGIARLFTPEEGPNEPTEVWYLFGAWMLAATMNAMLTWWGVSLAILNHDTLGNAVVERQTLLRVVPIFVAILVWLIRVLIIGSFSVAGDRLFSQATVRPSTAGMERSERFPARSLNNNSRPISRPAQTRSTPVAASSAAPRPASRPNGQGQSEAGYTREPRERESGYTRPEPTYHPASMDSPNGEGRSNTRRQL